MADLVEDITGDSFEPVIFSFVFGVFFFSFFGVQEMRAGIISGNSFGVSFLNWKMLIACLLFLSALVLFGMHINKEFRQ